MGHGQDMSLCYVRELQEFDAQSEFFKKEKLPAHIKPLVEFGEKHYLGHINLHNTPSKKWHEVSTTHRYALVGGIIYPCMIITERSRSLTETCYSYCYTFDEAQAIMDEHDYDISKGKSRNRRWLGWSDFDRFNVKSFFELRGSTLLQAFAYETGMPVATFNRRYVSLNARLADIELYRTLDAWQAYQEISMFLGNLASKDDTPIKIADKDRIAQHGFDKWSFRKPPSK